MARLSGTGCEVAQEYPDLRRDGFRQDDAFQGTDSAHPQRGTLADDRGHARTARPHRNAVHLLYSKDGQGQAKVGAKHLLEASLRMRPDRILLQELRDGTAFFYLRNVNSGHPGSITTVHADSAALAFEPSSLLAQASEGGRDFQIGRAPV